jgi:DNA primase
MIDTDALLRNINLLDVVERDLGAPLKSRGKHHLFRCPGPAHQHGDAHPSLDLNTETQRVYCNVCGKAYNAIGWVMWRQSLPFVAACKLLANGDLPQSGQRPEPEPERIDPPSDKWQNTGLKLLDRAQEILRSATGAEARRYLSEKRQLNQHSMDRWRLGYIPADIYMPYAAWGLTGDGRGVWLPRGIVIPTIDPNGCLWSVHVRRPDGKPKYLHIAGSKKGLWGAGNCDRRVVTICGGEFDAMLVQQLCGDIVGACSPSTGEGSHLAADWLDYLLSADLIICAYDADEAGQAGAWEKVLSITSRSVIAKPPVTGKDKDVTDFALSGGNVWRWLYDVRQRELKDTVETLFERLQRVCHTGIESRREYYLDLRDDLEAAMRKEQANELLQLA